jgi:hypothetical protein
LIFYFINDINNKVITTILHLKMVKQETLDTQDSQEIIYTQETQDILDTQDTVIIENMSQSLDNYYCDDYDDTDNDTDNDDIYTQDLITCDNCGNRWDGYAQCNCYQIKCYELIETDDEKEQEQDLENPARKFSENDETESENNEDTFKNINDENINSEN